MSETFEEKADEIYKRTVKKLEERVEKLKDETLSKLEEVKRKILK